MRTLSPLVILMFAGVSVLAQSSPKPDATPASSALQQFVPVSQPDAPLRIVSAEVKWATPDDKRAVQVYIRVENISQKTIHTYSTRRDLDTNPRSEGCLGPPKLPARGLLPAEKAGTSTWQGVPKSDPAPRVWVDFVEFSDGARWGADECQMAERSDGALAGARAQRDQLMKIFREQGAEALMKFIKDNFQKEIDRRESGEGPKLLLSPPPGHSKRWEEGFAAGAREVIQRIITADREWGLDEIEHELSRTIGLSEKKKP